jgi:hypothetical protein
VSVIEAVGFVTVVVVAVVPLVCRSWDKPARRVLDLPGDARVVRFLPGRKSKVIGRIGPAGGGR